MNYLLLSNVVEFLNFVAHRGNVLGELREPIPQVLSHPSKLFSKKLRNVSWFGKMSVIQKKRGSRMEKLLLSITVILHRFKVYVWQSTDRSDEDYSERRTKKKKLVLVMRGFDPFYGSASYLALGSSFWYMVRRLWDLGAALTPSQSDISASRDKARAVTVWDWVVQGTFKVVNIENFGYLSFAKAPKVGVYIQQTRTRWVVSRGQLELH